MQLHFKDVPNTRITATAKNPYPVAFQDDIKIRDYNEYVWAASCSRNYQNQTEGKQQENQSLQEVLCYFHWNLIDLQSVIFEWVITMHWKTAKSVNTALNIPQQTFSF